MSWAPGEGSPVASGLHVSATLTGDPPGLLHGPEPRPTRFSVADSTSIGYGFEKYRTRRSSDSGQLARLCCSPGSASSPSPAACGPS